MKLICPLMWIFKYCGKRLSVLYEVSVYLSLLTLAKARTHQFTQLENKIQSLQNLQKQHFTEQQATQLSSLKEEYDLLSHSKAEFILHRTRQKYYFESERPSHLLALRLKECKCRTCVEERTHTHTLSATTKFLRLKETFVSICKS